MKISVVIPNYNGEKLLPKNIPRVVAVLNDYAQKHSTTVQLIICDDGSRDSSSIYLKELENKKKDGKVLYTIGIREKNGGFSANVNYGVSLATSDILILLNTDVIPEKGFLEPLIKHFKDENVFAVGCMDKSVEENGQIVLRGRGVGSWVRGFLQHGKGDLAMNNTLWVSGGSGAFSKKIWDEVGGLTELMNPFYWEDIDISYRAQKFGYVVRFEKESIVRHEHEAGSIKQNTKPYKVRVISYRNQFYFVWLNISDWSLMLSHIIWLPFHIFSAAKGRDIAFLKGFSLAMLNVVFVLKQRARNLSRFKISDKIILSQFSEESSNDI